MPAVMPATLAPRTAGARAGEVLAAAGARWRRHIRQLSLDAQRQRDLRHPHDLSLFSSSQFNLYRLVGRLPRSSLPTPPWKWLPPGRWQRLGPYNIVYRFDPPQRPAFELPPRNQNVPTPPNLHITHKDIIQAYASVAPSYGPSSGNAFSAGAAVLALAAVVLLVAVLEHCLDRTLFKQHVREEGTEACLESPDVPLPPGDPPPPYSMCLPKSRQDPSAEPPPPYSACYVAFGAHDLPTVHLNVPTSHLFQDTGQMSHTHNSDVSVTSEVARGSNGDLSADPAELRPNRGEASQGATVFPNSPLA